jgi:hypothetical protein
LKKNLYTQNSDPKSSVSKSKNREITRFTPSSDIPYHKIIFLQSSIGNQAVGKLLNSGFIKPKLRINVIGLNQVQRDENSSDSLLRRYNTNREKIRNIERTIRDIDNNIAVLQLSWEQNSCDALVIPPEECNDLESLMDELHNRASGLTTRSESLQDENEQIKRRLDRLR